MNPLRIFIALALLFASWASAFTWDPIAFPEGNQRYVFEITVEGSDGPAVSTLDYQVVQTGDTYETVSTLTVRSSGVTQDELSDAMFGGEALATFGFGPMLAFYGPAIFMLPMMLGTEDIHVRSEPIRVAGMGSLIMDHSEQFAGIECVVIEFVPDDGSSSMQFALAEGLPFPCYSSYGDEGSRTIVRLIQAE